MKIEKHIFKKRGVSIVELTLSLFMVSASVFALATLDILSLTQSANDARVAIANLHMRNELALIRSSLQPGQGVTQGSLSYLDSVASDGSLTGRRRFPTVVGQSTTNIGERLSSDIFADAQNRVVRTLLSLEETSHGITHAVYDVEISVPITVGRRTEEFVIKESVSRFFSN